MQAADSATTRRLADLPSPRGLPLLGNLHQLDLPRLHRVLGDWHGELGSPYLIRLGGKPVYVSADPAVANRVLRERPGRYRRVRQIEACIAELGANGLFSVEGAAWEPQRRLVMQALNATHFHEFFPTIRRITQRLQGRWAQAAARGAVVDMKHDLVLFTVDVTTALAFGEDPNTMEKSGNRIQDALAHVFPMLMARINAPLPYWRYVRLPRDRRLDRAVRVIHEHIDALVAAARQRLAAEPARAPRNVLDSLLRAAELPDSGITQDDVRANVMTMLLAGEDTTAHALSWTMYFLAQHPQWQQRLRAEASQVLGSEGLPQTLEQVRALDLVEAAANEALRLKPVASLLFLEANEDVEVDGVLLPAGTPLFLVLPPAMQDAACFARPHEYRPDRWLHGHALGAHDAKAFLAFGAGPRVCPGRHLAAVEMRMVLSMLLRNFSFELAVDPGEVEEVQSFVLMPSQMPIRLRPAA